MAQFDEISEADATQIAKLIGEWIGTTPKFVEKVKRDEKAGLGESMQVWSLSLAAINNLDDRFRKTATNTKRWHHQVRFAEKTVAFARTKFEADLNAKKKSAWEVVRLTESQLPVEIDDAIQWADDADLPNGTVRLLTIDPYHTTAFWLETDQIDLVVVISTPKEYPELRRRRAFERTEFLRIISQYSYVQGVPVDEREERRQ